MSSAVLSYLARFGLSWFAFGALLHLSCGNDLGYEIYHCGVLVDEEPLSERGRVLISAFVGLVLAAVCSTVLWLASLWLKEPTRVA